MSAFLFGKIRSCLDFPLSFKYTVKVLNHLKVTGNASRINGILTWWPQIWKTWKPGKLTEFEYYQNLRENSEKFDVLQKNLENSGEM